MPITKLPPPRTISLIEAAEVPAPPPPPPLPGKKRGRPRKIQLDDSNDVGANAGLDKHIINEGLSRTDNVAPLGGVASGEPMANPLGPDVTPPIQSAGPVQSGGEFFTVKVSQTLWKDLILQVEAPTSVIARERAKQYVIRPRDRHPNVRIVKDHSLKGELAGGIRILPKDSPL